MSSPETQIDQAAAKRFAMVRAYLKTKLGKMSQTDIGEVCGVTQGMIAHIENGIREIPFSALKALYLKYNISPTYIIAGDVKIEPAKADKTLLTDTADLRAEIEILRAQIKKMEQDIRILSQNRPRSTGNHNHSVTKK